MIEQPRTPRKINVGRTAKLFAGALALSASLEACAPTAAASTGHTLDAVATHTMPEAEHSFSLSEMAIVLHPPEAARDLIEIERALPPDAYAAREAIGGMIGAALAFQATADLNQIPPQSRWRLEQERRIQAFMSLDNGSLRRVFGTIRQLSADGRIDTHVMLPILRTMRYEMSDRHNARAGDISDAFNQAEEMTGFTPDERIVAAARLHMLLGARFDPTLQTISIGDADWLGRALVSGSPTVDGQRTFVEAVLRAAPGMAPEQIERLRVQVAARCYQIMTKALEAAR